MTSKPNRAMIDADIEWMNKMATEGDEELANMDTELLRREEATARANKDAAYLAETARNIREYNASSKSKKADVIDTTHILPPKDRFIVGDKTPKFDHNEFSKWLIDESGEHFVTTRDDGSIYIYRDGIYIPDGESFVRTIIDNVMDGDLVTTHNKNETIGHVRDRTFADRSVFDGGGDILNLANGLYDMRTDEFLPHSPHHKSLCKSAVKYDPDATCPNIDIFIRESVEPHRVNTMYEIGGYALVPHKRIKRGFVLLGDPDTGKTQMMNMYIKFVGKESTSAVNPIMLARYPHAGANLYGKLLNVIDDLGESPLAETGIIKSVVGDGIILCNQKNKPAYPFVAEVVNVWGCNVLPKSADPYFGDKFDVIKFDNVFGGHAKPDRFLIDKITTDEEMSGFFNKCVQAYRQIEESGEFTGSRDQKGRQDDWLKCSCPIAKFVEDRCTIQNGTSLVLKNGFHKAYNLWVKSNGLKREKKFEIKDYLSGIGVEELKVTERGHEKYGRHCFLGIDLLTDNEIQKNKTLERFDPKTKKDDIVFGSPSSGGFCPTDPEIFPIVTSTKNQSINIGASIGEISGSLCEKVATDGDPKTKPTNFVFGSDDIDGKLRLTFSKLSVQNPSNDGWSIEQITEAYPQITSSKHIKNLLDEQGHSLGLVESRKGWRIK